MFLDNQASNKLQDYSKDTDQLLVNELRILNFDDLKDDVDLLSRDNEGNINMGLSPKTYEPTTVLLLKGVPYDISEIDILNLVKSYGVLYDIYLVRHKGYAYIQFKVN